MQHFQSLPQIPVEKYIELPPCFQRLTQSQLDQIITQFVNYITTPRSDSIYSHFASKFQQIQTQVVSVIEYRVRLQQALELQKLKQSHFQTVCQMYDIIKQKNIIIDELAKKNKDIDNKYLMKVVELDEERTARSSLVVEVEELKKKLDYSLKDSNKVARVSSLSDQRNEMAQLQMQIIILKQLFRNAFSTAEGQFSLREIDSNIPLQKRQNTQSPQAELIQEVSLLKSNLNLRLQILEESDDITRKYQSTQQQLIDGLVDQLMRQKDIFNAKFLKMEAEHKKQPAKEDSQLIHEAYEKSQNGLSDLLENELIEMKSRLERASSQFENQLDLNEQLKQKISELQQQLLSRQQEILHLGRNLQQSQKEGSQSKQTFEQQMKQSQLLYDSRIQQLQLRHIEDIERHNFQISLHIEKIQKLQLEITRIKNQTETIQSQNLQMFNQQLQKLKQSNQSLHNQKILLKSLNKKFNKDLTDSQEHNKNLIAKNKQLEQTILDLQNLKKQNQQTHNLLKHHLSQKQLQLTSLRSQLQEHLLSKKKLELAAKEQQQQKLKQQQQQKLEQIHQNKQKQTKRLRQSEERLRKELQKMEHKIKSKNIGLIEAQGRIDLLENQIERLSDQSQRKSERLLEITKEDDFMIEEKLKGLQQRDNNLLIRENLIKEKQMHLQTQQNSILKGWNDLYSKQNDVRLQQQDLKLSADYFQQKKSDLSQYQAELSRKQEQMDEKQVQLNKRQAELNIKLKQFKKNKSELDKKSKELEKQNISIQERQNQLGRQQRLVQEKVSSIQGKQNHLNLKQKQLVKRENELKQRQTQLIEKIKQIKSEQKLLSPPPSPREQPQSSPPESPSPLKLQSSQPMIPQCDDQKGGPSQQFMNKEMIDINRIGQTCRVIAQDWMKQEQEKWNILQHEVDYLYKLLLENQI